MQRMLWGLMACLFVRGQEAMAKPRTSSADTNVSPEQTPVVEQNEPLKGAGELDRYREAFRVINRVASTSEEIVTALVTMAELAVVAKDGDLRMNALTAYDMGVATLFARDQTRAVAAVRQVLTQHPNEKAKFRASYESIYDKLAAEAKLTPTPQVASLGAAAVGDTCKVRTQQLEDLVRIAPEIDKANDLAMWRSALATHLMNCSPTPEGLAKAYDIWIGMPKVPEATSVAGRAADAYLERFVREWKMTDFEQVRTFWARAGVEDFSTKRGVLEPVVEAALKAEQFEAAAAVLDVYDLKRASATRQALQK